MGRKMKGISPLIAAVLLIAFTVAIATLVMGWFSTFTRTTTTSVTNSTSLAINCADARVTIRDVYIQAGVSGLTPPVAITVSAPAAKTSAMASNARRPFISDGVPPHGASGSFE